MKCIEMLWTIRRYRVDWTIVFANHHLFRCPLSDVQCYTRHQKSNMMRCMWHKKYALSMWKLCNVSVHRICSQKIVQSVVHLVRQILNRYEGCHGMPRFHWKLKKSCIGGLPGRPVETAEEVLSKCWTDLDWKQKSLLNCFQHCFPVPVFSDFSGTRSFQIPCRFHLAGLVLVTPFMSVKEILRSRVRASQGGIDFGDICLPSGNLLHSYWLIMGKSWEDHGKTRVKQPIILDE